MSCESRAFRRERALRSTRLGEGIFELAVSWEGPSPKPGQFFMLRAARSTVLLGRPISVYDADAESLTFIIAERGPGTKELGELRNGEMIMVEGPLGSSWDEEAIAKTSGPLALVGGGIGLAPILFLARKLPPGSFDLYAGYRSGSWGLEGVAARETRIFTEDGSRGSKGRVLDGFEAGQYAGVLACGPEPMLRSVASLAKAGKVPAWISLERRMACGVGACLGCSVPTRTGNKRACVEGPVFAAEEVIFDE